MHGRAIALLVIATLALAPRARAELKNLNGQPAPELGALEQAGGADRVASLAALRGRAVLIVFFDTSVAACDRDAPQLEELWKKGRARGLIVLGVSAEPAEKLDAFVKKHGPTYPIVSSPATVKAYEVDGYPTKYLVAPSGKVVASEHSNVTTAMIEEQLAAAVTYPLRDYSKKLEPILAALRARDYGKAAPELAKLERQEDTDGEHARALIAWLEALGGEKVAAAAAAREQGDLFGARDLLADVEAHFPPGYACTKRAREDLKALKDDKDSKKVFALEKDFRAAVAAERENDAAKAAQLYMKCSKAAPGTRFAERCLERSRALSEKK